MREAMQQLSTMNVQLRHPNIQVREEHWAGWPSPSLTCDQIAKHPSRQNVTPIASLVLSVSGNLGAPSPAVLDAKAGVHKSWRNIANISHRQSTSAMKPSLPRAKRHLPTQTVHHKKTCFTERPERKSSYMGERGQCRHISSLQWQGTVMITNSCTPPGSSTNNQLEEQRTVLSGFRFGGRRRNNACWQL